MSPTNIYGIKSTCDSTTSSFKVISNTHTITLNDNASNILNLSAKGNCIFLNSFESLSRNYISTLAKIGIRVDYLDEHNNSLFKAFTINEVVTICTDEDALDEDCLIEINIIDLQILDFKGPHIILSTTFHVFVET